jgi:sec-independent protein translocase protein TatA
MGLENPLHIAMLLLVVLMLFGAKRLPEMGRGLGDGMRSFKDAISGNGNATNLQLSSEPAEPLASPVRSADAVGQPRPE